MFLSHGVPPALSFTRNRSPLHPDLFPLVFWGKVEKGGAAVGGGGGGSGGRREEESSAVFTVWALRGILLPRPALALPLLTSGRCSRVRGSRSGGGDLCRRRGGGWLCQSPVFSSPTPLLHLSSLERRDREHREEKHKGGPLLRRLCGWTALGRARGQTGAAATWGGAARPAACRAAFQTF